MPNCAWQAQGRGAGQWLSYPQAEATVLGLNRQSIEHPGTTWHVVVAIENELGTAAARNYVLKNGAVTITGLKTFQDGAEFGSGNKAATGLVRLPNTGAVKWRKADARHTSEGTAGVRANRTYRGQ